MKFLIKHIILFLIGGCIYSAIEISARGYTHPSMFILGGLCFICIGWLNEFLNWNDPLVLQMIAGGAIVTFLELLTGFYVNIYKGWHVWDYTDMPFNFMGQICLPFSLMWCLLSLIGILIDDYIRYKYFGEEKPKYRII